jgi:hypothetical protein
MKNKLLKLFITASISTVVFIGVREIAHACAYADFGYTTEGYSLFPQNMIGSSSLAPFLFEPSQPYFSGLLNADTLNPWTSNEAEWASFLGKQVSEKEVIQLVYKTKLANMIAFKMAVMHRTPLGNDTLKKNGAAMVINGNNDVEVADYLVFAKEVEPLATAGQSNWETSPAKDSIRMLELSLAAEAQARKTKRPFLKCRYVYQAARLAHYCSHYTRCLDLCKEFRSVAQRDSYIDRSMQALEAGAMKHLGDYAGARYHFAMQFDKYYKDNYDFYYSNFAYSTPLKWSYDHTDGFLLPPLTHSFPDSSSGYQLCKNKHEQTVMFFLDAYGGNSPELEAIKKIYALEPGSEYLDVLLIRTFCEIEAGGFFHKRKLTIRELMEYKYGGEPLVPFRQFVDYALKKGNLKRPYLWQYALGHLAFMQKDFASARISFALAAKQAPAEVPVKQQAQIMEILMEVELASTIDGAFETKETSKLDFMKSVCKQDDRERYLYLRLAQRYEEQGDSVKALCCYAQTFSAVDLTQNAESHPLGKIIDWLGNPNKTPFELYLQSRFNYSPAKVNEIQGTVYLRAHHLQEAANCFEKAGALDTLPADPFLDRMIDCHDCDFIAKKETNYTKLTLVKRLMALEKKSNDGGEGRAIAAYQAGNAYYNMSFYGNSWMSQAYFRSDYDTVDQFLDCSVARYFYEKARKLSDDREFQARCVYMEAKCEQNAYYQMGKILFEESFDERNKRKPALAKGYYKSYELLSGSYADTKFYQEAIKECSYFRGYVNSK